MGQKSNPTALRLGIVEESSSVWFSKEHYASYLLQDLEVRTHIKKKLKGAGISNVRIFRKSGHVSIEVYASRPGLIIGKGGGDIAILRQALRDKLQCDVNISIKEEKSIETSAQLISETLAAQLEKRFHFRRAMKAVVQRAMKSGAQGIRVECSGRLAGAEIARREWYREGRVPLHTFRAKIKYATCEAHTTYGIIGIKVWVFTGEASNIKSDTLPVKISEQE
ncbi:30S ribosomal protein S3 [bacterium]|jgi:small subunit ribosomal protein S3|nr:30S ribosomal protein S3 [bacterium]|tara:strand:+ start:1266 stop:1934 length:669 start_codon:yes stop_codon:yes gene_type:complete